jgi:hypothetical protein
MSRTLFAALALFLSLTLTACEDNAGVGGTGSLSIFLTDNPGFLEAWVKIRQVELVGGGDGEEGGIVVLRDDLFEQDLLTLANDVVLLVDETLPAGTYSQLRFLIPDACVVIGDVVDGEDVPTHVYASSGYEKCYKEEITTEALQLPSFDQSGIKVNLPHEFLEVAPGEERALLVDFDVSESFGQQAGMSGMWVMTPVINAEDMALSRSIQVDLTLDPGMILPPIEEDGVVTVPDPTLADYFQAWLDTETEPTGFSDPDDDGTFTASFLHLFPDRDYQVSVELKEGLELSFELSPPSPQTVTLSSAENAEVAFQVSPPGS